ncbi:hypothetical protein TNCV_359851 [Trichonephila clavipes]|nr:hypothetical protein TNCV_359851 [Trichonephila clavipes]
MKEALTEGLRGWLASCRGTPSVYYITFNISFFLLLRRHVIEIVGAATPQKPRERFYDDVLKTECRNLWRNGFSELTLDHVSEKGSRDFKIFKT